MADFHDRLLEEYEKEIQKAKLETAGPQNPKEPYVLRGLLKNIAAVLEKELGSPQSFWEEHLQIEEPPAHVKADLTLNLFKVADTLNRAPADLARDILESFKKRPLAPLNSLEIQGAFINITLDLGYLTRAVLGDVLTYGDRYGRSTKGEGKTALIEYSSPNIAKPIGIGHIRSTIIGQALANLYGAVGWKVIRDNFLGDWGTQFGKLIVALEHWAPKDVNLAELSVDDLKNYYVKFHEHESPELLEEAARRVDALEKGDAHLVALWQALRQKSIDGLKKTYERLGVAFDFFSGESYFVTQAEEVIGDCLKHEVCHHDPENPKSQAVIADTLENLPSVILKKSDGTTLYLGRDLAALRKRSEAFQPAEFLYVVAEEQTLHFRQLFALAKKLGYGQETIFRHISFGMVLVSGKKMSTRKGSLIELEELLSESVERAEALLKEKGDFEDQKERGMIAEIVGVGAIIYNDLRQSRTKNISFDWEKMLDLEGGSSVYLQYTHARIRSIERKFPDSVKDVRASLLEPSETKLLVALARFPKIIERSVEEQSPHFIATYLEDLAQRFNTFYGQVRIVETEDKDLQISRRALIRSVATVIKNGLQLLNISVPERL